MWALLISNSICLYIYMWEKCCLNTKTWKMSINFKTNFVYFSLYLEHIKCNSVTSAKISCIFRYIIKDSLKKTYVAMCGFVSVWWYKCITRRKISRYWADPTAKLEQLSKIVCHKSVSKILPTSKELPYILYTCCV